MKNAYIYTLTDPRKPDAVRYVGQTNNVNRRLWQHENTVADVHISSQKDIWLQRLRDSGYKPLLNIIETVPASDALSAEKRWIQKLSADGADLLNGQFIYEPKRLRYTFGMNEKDFLTVPEAALFMGIHYNTVYAAMLEGRLPYVEIVGRKVITRTDAEAYKERTRVAGEKPKGRPKGSANRKKEAQE